MLKLHFWHWISARSREKCLGFFLSSLLNMNIISCLNFLKPLTQGLGSFWGRAKTGGISYFKLIRNQIHKSVFNVCWHMIDLWVLRVCTFRLFKKKKNPSPSTRDVSSVTLAALRLPAGKFSPIFSSFSRRHFPPFLDFALQKQKETSYGHVHHVHEILEK